MRFRFIWTGKTKDKNWRALQEEYLRRLSHFVKCELIELKEPAKYDGPEKEGNRILQAIASKGLVIALDTAGKQFSSHELASEIDKWQSAGHKEIEFLIGGAEGISPAIREKADLLLSLSFLTFTHEMARVVLLEQLYRGYSIIKGFPYQK